MVNLSRCIPVLSLDSVRLLLSLDRKKMGFNCSTCDTLVKLLTLDDAMHRHVAMFGFCIFLADVVSRTPWGKKGSPFQSFGILLVTAFGGGFLAPILLGVDGHFPYPLANDLHFLVCLAAWAIHQYSGAWTSLYQHRHVRAAVAVLFEVLRARTLFHWWKVSSEAIPASHFSVPMFGPIIIGALGGCGGLVFLHGRDFLASPLNWLVASALVGTVALTFLTSDIGGTLAGYAGADPTLFKVSTSTCHAGIAAYFVQTRLVNLYFPSKEKND